MCEIESGLFVGTFMSKVERAPALWRDRLQIQKSVFPYSGEPIRKKKNVREKPTTDRLSIWVSHVLDLFLLKQLSECWYGFLTGRGSTLEGSYPSYGQYVPFRVQSLLRFPFLTSHNSTWFHLEEKLELSWFHLYPRSHIYYKFKT